MAQQSNDLRERLLAALPQPENLAAYREETAALLSRHARALRSDYFTTNLILLVAFVLALLWVGNRWHLGADTVHFFEFASGFMLLAGVIYDVRYRIYKSQIGTLKEIKQVQVQILEIQASLRKEP